MNNLAEHLCGTFTAFVAFIGIYRCTKENAYYQTGTSICLQFICTKDIVIRLYK